MAKERRASFYAGVFCLCMSLLMLQIVQTRILSVASYYYLAFLSISMAMFGLTAGALIVYFKRDSFNARHLSFHLTWMTTAYAITVAVCFSLQLSSALITVPWATVVVIWLEMILLLGAPYVWAGMAVSLALTRSPFPIGIIYGVDLAGAASGCLMVIGLLHLIDAPSAMFIVASIAALAAFCFARAGVGATPAAETAIQRIVLRRPGCVAIGLLGLGLANAATPYGLQLVFGKHGIEPREFFEIEKWNSFSRVVAYKSQVQLPFVWGPSPKMPQGLYVEQRLLNIDGFAATAMPRFNGDLRTVDFLRYDITNLGYYIRNAGRAAVIGVGSGRDLLSAHLFGFRDVYGIELNPIFLDLLADPAKLRGYGGLAELPDLHFIVDEGRSWFARTKKRFDLIQMSMIDTFAATGAGAFSLSENGLYTVEAWKVFFSALNPNGVFTVSRWHSPYVPVETGRLLSLAMAALFSLGDIDPQNHIFVASTGYLSTIIVCRQPLTPTDIQHLTDVADRFAYQILVSPERPVSAGVLKDLLAARSLSDLDARAERYPLDVRAPTDAHPFFFNQLRLNRPEDIITMLREYRRTGDWYSGSNLVAAGNLLACGTLALIVVLSAILVAAIVILPARSSVRLVDPRLVRSGTGYFLFIGLGFMFVEIGLVQRMSALIGHPIYALSIVLFSLILSTGIGSLISEPRSIKAPAHLCFWLGGLCSYLLVLPFCLPVLIESVQPQQLLARAGVIVVLIAPAGLLMGFGFPTGMRLAQAADARPTPWFWGINGAGGVLAAGLGVGCSIAFSIDTTIRLGALCYLLVLPAGLGLLKQSKRSTC